MKRISKAEWIYGRLLRVYPRGFRAEYEEAMAAHFRDLWRDARRGGWVSMGKFWVGIGADTLAAAVRARFSEKRERSTGAAEFNVMKIPSLRFLFVAFLAPLLIGLGMWIWLQPRTYTSVARILTERAGNPAESSLDPISLRTPLDDLKHMQTQFEILKSSVVLERVVNELQLAKRFGEELGLQMKSSEAVEELRRRIEFRQAKDTALIEIRAFSRGPREAADIANRIAESYQRSVTAAVRVEVVDMAQPSIRPVRPNVPLLLVMGTLMCGVLAGVGALLLRMVAAGRGNDGVTVAG